MRRRKCLRYRRATKERRGVGRWKCTRPVKSEAFLTFFCRFLTFTIGSVALENSSFWSCDRQNPSTLPLCAWMTLRRSYVSRL